MIPFTLDINIEPEEDRIFVVAEAINELILPITALVMVALLATRLFVDTVPVAFISPVDVAITVTFVVVPLIPFVPLIPGAPATGTYL
jgi:hypothetical protein